MISFVEVSKFILTDFSMHIPEGVSVGVIGETGSGKTTFLKLACGLLQPSQGRVYTLGKDVAGYPERIAPLMGVLFAQIPLLDPEQTVWDNLQNRGAIYRMSQDRFQQEYEKLSKLLGFDGFWQEKVKSLSMGQRRRVELGAVFLPSPRLLLLDEPTIGLDQKGKEAFRGLVQEREALGLTTVVTSHDMSDISATCSRIAILSHGKLCTYGNQNLLLKKYAPMDVMLLTLQSGVPDLEDLPVKSYSMDGNHWKVVYNSNYVTATELLRTVLVHCSVKEVSIRKPSLEDVIMEINRERENTNGVIY